MALRQTLLPFLYDLLHRYHADYEPMVRPTWLDFPNDPGAWAESDDHLLGPDLLVALVCEPGAIMRVVRPPAGADWIDVWTGARLPGGAAATLDAPLDGPPPLLARVGSAMLVDLARGGWRPEPYRRGIWLFPPTEGEVAWEAVEDAGDGDHPPARWRLSGRADTERIDLELTCEGPIVFGDDRVTLLLSPGDKRALRINGGVAERVSIDGRDGITLTVTSGDRPDG